MNNPYIILAIPQNATKQEIIKAGLVAMKERKYSLPEIHEAQKQLLSPSKRLVADFMFPLKIKAKRPQLIDIKVDFEVIDISSVNENAFDNL